MSELEYTSGTSQHPIESRSSVDDLFIDLLKFRDQQIGNFAFDPGLRKQLEEKWEGELRCSFPLFHSVDGSKIKLSPLQNLDKSCEASCQFPDPDSSCTSAPNATSEIHSRGENTRLPRPDHESSLFQGGLQRPDAGPSSNHCDAAIQVTPKALQRSHLQIDLSKIHASDSRQHFERNRIHLQLDTEDERSFFASNRTDSTIPDTHRDPPRRLRNLSKKKVADHRRQQKQSSGTSSTTSESSPRQDSLRQKPSQPQPRVKSSSEEGKVATCSPLGDGSADLWVVAKLSHERSPTGEKVTKLGFRRVDVDAPCDVSKYAVGGVLTMNTSVFDVAGQQGQLLNFH